MHGKWDDVVPLVLGVKVSLHESLSDKSEVERYTREHDDYHEGVKQKARRRSTTTTWESRESSRAER